jgi:integrase
MSARCHCRFIKRQERRERVHALTRDEVTVFLSAAQEHYLEYYPLFLCAFRTGMRMGELLGLAWTDIDFTTNTICVKRSFTHGHWSTPKSGRTRTVDMSNQLRAVLLDHRQTLVKRDLKLPSGETIQLAFPFRAGTPLLASNLRRRVFVKIIDATDLPRF